MLKYMLNGKATITLLTVGLIKKISLYKNDLANLKSDFDKVDIDELKTIPSGLRSLKSKVYKLDIAKLETAPVDLSKLSDVAKNDIT